MSAIMTKTVALLVGAAMLAGCQITNDERQTRTFGETARGIIARQLGRTEPTVDPRQALTPALLAQSQTPVLLVVQKDIDAASVLVPVGTGADGTVQWRDTSGAGLLMRGGVLVGTRGIGFDLLTVDDTELRAALIAGGARDVARTERRLRGDDIVIARDLLCDVIPVKREQVTLYGRGYPTTLFEERCAGDGPSFVNRYWLGTDGAIRKSEVFVSEEAGLLQMSLVKG